jgi:hypothetical protein
VPATVWLTQTGTPQPPQTRSTDATIGIVSAELQIKYFWPTGA